MRNRSIDLNKMPFSLSLILIILVLFLLIILWLLILLHSLYLWLLHNWSIHSTSSIPGSNFVSSSLAVRFSFINIDAFWHGKAFFISANWTLAFEIVWVVLLQFVLLVLGVFFRSHMRMWLSKLVLTSLIELILWLVALIVKIRLLSLTKSLGSRWTLVMSTLI